MTLPPEQWAQATAALTPEAFRERLDQEGNEERLLACIEYEAERSHGTRPERIGVCNKRLQRLRD